MPPSSAPRCHGPTSWHPSQNFAECRECHPAGSEAAEREQAVDRLAAVGKLAAVDSANETD